MGNQAYMDVKMQREVNAVLRKINKALRQQKGAYLSLWDLERLALLVESQGERAAAHEAMLHTFVQRVYGDTCLSVH